METIHRKRLHNQIEDMKGKIRVYCRVRPLNEKEAARNCVNSITIVDQFTLKIKLKKAQQVNP